MKTITTLVLAVALLLFIATPGSAQTTTTRTFLSTAMTDTSGNTLTVGSATGILASSGTNGQTFLFIDQELMQIRAISGTQVTVIRGVKGRASTHLAGESVWYGIGGTYSPATGNVGIGVFVDVEPAGRCVRANNTFLPVINPNTGSIFDCILGPSANTGVTTQGTTSQWVSTNLIQVSKASPFKKLRPEQTTYTLLPSDEIVVYNTNVAGTITIPALTGFVGKQFTILMSVTGGQSLTIATSTGQLINGAASIIIGGAAFASGLTIPNFQGIQIYGDGTDWFAPIPIKNP